MAFNKIRSLEFFLSITRTEQSLSQSKFYEEYDSVYGSVGVKAHRVSAILFNVIA